MKALLCREFGAIEKLRVEEIASPGPGPGEVVIDVKAASLNFPDALMVQGLYQVKPPLPFSPGLELAGVVKELGEGVHGAGAGDRVFASPGKGAFAEECVARADALVRLPPDLDFETAAALLLTYGTSLHALQDCAGLRPGETLVVLGAAGGVGTAAVEIGKALGARVIAAASGDEKLALCRQLGADEAINYQTEDLRQRILDLTSGRGADVIYDPVGGPYTEPALRATAWRGRLLVIGFAAGAIPQVRLNHLLLKERSAIGVYWGEWAAREPAAQARSVEQLLGWIAGGRIRPAVRERVSLHEVPDAMQRLLERKVMGKVIVLPEARGDR